MDPDSSTGYINLLAICHGIKKNVLESQNTGNGDPDSVPYGNSSNRTSVGGLHAGCPRPGCRSGGAESLAVDQPTEELSFNKTNRINHTFSCNVIKIMNGPDIKFAGYSLPGYSRRNTVYPDIQAW